MSDVAFKKQLWISAAIIAASAVAAGIALYFLAGNIGALADKIIRTREAIANQSAEYGILASLKAGATNAVRYEAAIDKLLPSQDGVILFGSQVSDLSKRDGVSSNFSFQGDAVPAEASVPGNIGFTLSVTGPLASLSTFLEDLETKSPVVLSHINTIDLSQSGGSYTVSAQGRVFFK
jgi:hypothetical protein